MSQNEIESIFIKNIERGVTANILSFNDDKTRLTYHCSRNYSTSFRNPEEKVRASFFTELVLDYKYPKERIDIEVLVERRIPDDRADIVVYEDDVLKSPYIIIETKREGISDTEFSQAIEQAFRNAKSKRAMFAIVVAGNTKSAFNVAGFKSSEREKNVIADIPIKYGKTPKYRYIKGEKDKELKVAYREDLISALKKAHTTVWQGGKLAPTTAFDEVSKLLFCKLKDEKNTPKKNAYKFQIGTNETIVEINDRVQEIYSAAQIDDPLVFKEKINLSPDILYSVVEHLQGLSLNKTDLDTKGVAFEVFMQDFFYWKNGAILYTSPCCTILCKNDATQAV